MSEHNLKPCPFCGGEAELITIGNDFTKKRSAGIECGRCRTKQVVGAIRKSLSWCEETIVERWNKRICECEPIKS